VTVAVAAGPVRIGVSSCLLGQKVRYDGGHKHDRFVTDALGPFVEWVPVCPEVEAGLGIPRPTMHLARQGEQVRLVETASGKDHTQVMERFSRRRVGQLRKLGLSGYILKKDSPSCGMTRVKVRNPSGMPERVGTGLFAEALQQGLPGLPVEEEGRLNDSRLRENFIERIFAFERVTRLFSGRWSRGDVVAFHTAHKLQLMAHSTVAYRELGRWVAKVATVPRAEFKERYEREFMAALSKLATVARNTNVLQHAAGYFKRDIPGPQRTELSDLIHDYRKGLVPLVVPLTLVRHYVRLHQVDYLEGQLFLDPHPKELMLRNHV
jgi:uncharacterized protein YbgA (DUF1722 family)/uncharacterized protein YbbK (DUF523 family)